MLVVFPNMLKDDGIPPFEVFNCVRNGFSVFEISTFLKATICILSEQIEKPDILKMNESSCEQHVKINCVRGYCLQVKRKV